MTRTQLSPRTRARHRAARARHRRVRAAGTIAVAAASVVSLAVLAGLLSGGEWPWTFTTYLRWPQTILGTLAAVVLLYVRWWRTGLVFAGVAAGLVASVVAPTAALTTVPAPGERTLRIAVYNTGAGPGDVAAYARTIDDARPDVVVLLESADIADRLDARLDALSRLPTSDSTDQTLAPPVILAREDWPVHVVPLADTRPAAVVAAMVDGEPLEIVAFHPLPPVTRTWARHHDRSITMLVEAVLPRPGPHVLACDCNAAPWSPSLRRLLDTGLREPTVVPTFGAPLIGIPVDHVLLSDGVEAVSREHSPFDGSDHRLIVTEVTVGKTNGRDRRS